MEFVAIVEDMKGKYGILDVDPNYPEDSSNWMLSAEQIPVIYDIGFRHSFYA